MWIFDRHRPSHPWRDALAELRSSDDPTGAAVAHNWQMDHRVSEEREELLQSSGRWAEANTAGLWLQGLQSHFRREVCKPWLGHPTQHLSNRTNERAARIPGHERLVHIASLNRLLAFLETRVGTDFYEEFEELSGTPFPFPEIGSSGNRFLSTPSVVVDALVHKLQDRGAESVRQLAGLLLENLGPTQPPWWAGFAEEVRFQLAGEDGGGLCNSLGLGHTYAGEWLLAWVYEARYVEPPYRPTVIEANDNPFHFPSPPGEPWGITMPLEDGLPACREAVHAPLSGHLAVSACTGKLYRVSDHPQVYNQLSERRSSHVDRLRKDLPGAEARNWLDRHTENPKEP